MTIISTELMWSRQTARDESQDRKTFISTYGSAYQVVHSIDATLDEIKYAPGINVGSTYPSRSKVYCTDVSIASHGLILSVVAVSWKGESIAGVASDPVNMPPVIRYYSMTTTEPADTDGNGFPITNSIGEPVEGFTKDVHDMVLDVQRNYLAVSGKTALKYMDSTNSDAMVVFGDSWLPGQAALQEFSIDPVLGEDARTPQYFKVSAKVIFRQPYNTVPARSWFYRYTNTSLNNMSGIKVEISGGGGTGAAAYAVVNDSGVVTNIPVTNPGREYTSAPTVTITATDGGAGTGATATAVMGGFGDTEVRSVTVTAGGSGYKAGIVPAVDKNQERVTKPVLIKYNGQREKDAANTVWLERPQKSYSLPYSVLGLL